MPVVPSGKVPEKDTNQTRTSKMARKRLIDFGGQAAAGDEKRSVLVQEKNLISMRCLSCSKLNYCSLIELQRAATPRCNFCGGCLEETEESHSRRTGIKHTRTARLPKGLGTKPYTCKTCKTKFRSAVALSLHVKERHPEAEPINARQLELDYSFQNRHND